MQRSTRELYKRVDYRRDELEGNERAATIFGSVQDMYDGYDEDVAARDPEGALATLRSVDWGLRAVLALLDDEPPPPVVDLPEPERWAYAKLLLVAGSFGLLVAILLYEALSRS